MYLRDYNGSSWTEIGNASTFVKNSIIMVDVNYTISAGNELEVRLMVDN